MSEEKKEEVPLEISVDEFLTLSDEVPERGKVKESELLTMVEGKAMTAAGLAKAFSITYSAMWSRLKRLVNSGEVVRKYKEGKAFYLKRRPGMPPQIVAEAETSDEVDAEDFLDE